MRQIFGKREPVEFIDSNGARGTTIPDSWLRTPAPRVPTNAGESKCPTYVEPGSHRKELSAKGNLRALHSRRTPPRPSLQNSTAYKVSLPKSDLNWLRDRAELRNIAASRMVVQCGLGNWSLPVNTSPIISAERGWTMISLTIHEDEWDILAKNAATATWPEHRFAPQYPDPPAFCLLVALGMVQLANPGPVLLTQAEAECLQKFYKALWLGKIWNPWFLPMPPVPKLEDEIRAMKSRLEIHGLGPRDELEYKMASNAIDALVERHRSFMTLRTLMPLCDNAQLWEMVTKCCARIAKQ